MSARFSSHGLSTSILVRSVIIYLNHPAIKDALSNHKMAVQNRSDDLPAQCTCHLLTKYPNPRAPANKPEDHWVLKGDLLSQYLPTSQATLVSGSLNNKIFPNRKELAPISLSPYLTVEHVQFPITVPSWRWWIPSNFRWTPKSWEWKQNCLVSMCSLHRLSTSYLSPTLQEKESPHNALN